VKRPPPSSPQKSALMGRIRQVDTLPERQVAACLRAFGVGYRKNVRSLPGSPDFAKKKREWAVFVHGCFWHQHTGCRRATAPKWNRAFWSEKFKRNRLRDAAAIRALRSSGFKVAVIWECQLPEARQKLRKILEPSGIDMSEPLDH
jgi:DNA mismatch endonuclease Vsr